MWRVSGVKGVWCQNCLVKKAFGVKGCGAKVALVYKVSGVKSVLCKSCFVEVRCNSCLV